MRRCIVKGHLADFHRWEDKAEVISPGLTIGSHPGGQLWQVLGIVEYKDGTIHECYPNEVRFLDSKAAQAGKGGQDGN